jgi:hypothetical protein
MSLTNSYATLTDYKGTQSIDTIDALDDILIEQILESASQIINEMTGHTFYPRIETRYFSVPESWEDADELDLDDDLLEVITLTNGDATLVAAGNYNLLPRNESPRRAIRLKESANIIWRTDSSSNSEYVIAVNGVWGYHDQYSQRAWNLATQVNKIGGITASETPITVDLGNAIIPGQIFKIDNEFMICKTITSTSVTPIKRGDNGSTAAIHTDDALIYTWAPISSVRMACLEIAKSVYGRRFGVNTTGIATITAMGVVITPEEIPATAWRLIGRYKRDLVP